MFSTSKELQDRIKGLEYSLAQVSQAIIPHTELAAKLKTHAEWTQKVANEANARSQALQLRCETLDKKLSLANEASYL